jgi:hypothetical protein
MKLSRCDGAGAHLSSLNSSASTKADISPQRHRPSHYFHEASSSWLCLCKSGLHPAHLTGVTNHVSSNTTLCLPTHFMLCFNCLWEMSFRTTRTLPFSTVLCILIPVNAVTCTSIEGLCNLLLEGLSSEKKPLSLSYPSSFSCPFNYPYPPRMQTGDRITIRGICLYPEF